MVSAVFVSLEASLLGLRAAARLCVFPLQARIPGIFFLQGPSQTGLG